MRIVTAIGLILILALAIAGYAGEIQKSKADDMVLRHFPIDRTITYQGILKDDSGNPVPDNSYNLTFRVYEGPASATPVWTSPIIPVITRDGYFSAILSSVSLRFDTSYYLSIQVQGDAEMGQRQRMTLVPYSATADTANYAFRADTAAFALGSGSSHWTISESVLYTNGNWGIARGNAGDALYGEGAFGMVNLGVACTTGFSGGDASFSTVGGGYGNVAGGDYCVVAGGINNVASAATTTVAGGISNIASGSLGTIGGGSFNISNSYYGTIGGGAGNMADGDYGVVGGGVSNVAGGDHSCVGGGNQNGASGSMSAICGGLNNYAFGNSSFVGGGESDSASGYSSTIAGGLYNKANGALSTIGGGSGNTAGQYSTISGGNICTASGLASFVGGGYSNRALNDYSVASGGLNNTASGLYSLAGGGQENSAAGWYSVVSGGNHNLNEGNGSNILGGAYNTLTPNAYYSVAFGNSVYLDNAYRACFFGAANSGRVGVNRDDQGGVHIDHPLHIGTNTSNGNGAYLTAGGVWTNGSSRIFKENFTPFEGEELLSKISNLSVTTYNYINSTEKHVGPVAEEFVKAFDVGAIRESDDKRDDQCLAASDVAGVALAGVQELFKQNQELKAENENMKTMIANLEGRLSKLENGR